MNIKNVFLKRAYSVFAVFFWISMMLVLFQKEIFPSLAIKGSSGYEIAFKDDYVLRESWMGIYFKDKKMGFSNITMRQSAEDNVVGYIMNEMTVLRLNMLGNNKLVEVRGSSFFSEHNRLKKFNYNINSDIYKFSISGDIVENTLYVSVNTGSGKTSRSFPVADNTLVASSISPAFLFKKLKKEKELLFEVFDPISFGTNKIKIRKLDAEALTVKNIRYNTMVYETDFAGIKTKTWMTEDGDIVREDSGLGFTMIKEDRDTALKDVFTSRYNAPEFMSEFSVRSDKEILDPRNVSYLKLIKSNDVVEISRDYEVIEKDALPIPIENIPEEDFIYSHDQRIIDMANKIAGDDRNSWSVAKKIMNWVYNNVQKVPAISIPSSIDVLNTMKGDCNEHTVLFTALARSLGIPVKMMAGIVYLDKGFYYHAWPKVYIGRWINMDPTFGQEIADATHVPLIEGGIKEQIGLLKMIGDLKINVLEYK